MPGDPVGQAFPAVGVLTVVAAVRAGERLSLTVNRLPVADIVPHAASRSPWVSSRSLRAILDEAGAGLLADLDPLARRPSRRRMSRAIADTSVFIARQSDRPPGDLPGEIAVSVITETSSSLGRGEPATLTSVRLGPPRSPGSVPPTRCCPSTTSLPPGTHAWPTNSSAPGESRDATTRGSRRPHAP
jgi:antitoxin (DNA-binding transcriptional repressor) of toxin-antitoxin stability system